MHISLTLMFLFLNRNLLFADVPDDCDVQYGPSGLTKCVLLIPSYSIYQWATCVTDEFMQANSKSRNMFHKCVNRTRTYCWYQCMLYRFDDGGFGPVFDDCACVPKNNMSKSSSSMLPTTPDSCYNRNEENCNWLRSCVEEQHQCLGTGNQYEFKIVERICDMYSQKRSHFSIRGQQWINGVHKCIQTELTLALEGFNESLSCSKTPSDVFKLLVGCCENPGHGAPSVCEIPYNDWWIFFWTIRGSFNAQHLGSFLKSILDARSQCKMVNNVFDSQTDLVCLTVELVKEESVYDYTGKISLNLARQQTAEKVANEIAKNMNWNGVAWFGFLLDANSSCNFKSTVSLLLASKRRFDIFATDVPSVNLESVVFMFENTVANAKLLLNIQHYQLRVENVGNCKRVDCSSSRRSTETMISTITVLSDEINMGSKHPVINTDDLPRIHEDARDSKTITKSTASFSHKRRCNNMLYSILFILCINILCNT